MKTWFVVEDFNCLNAIWGDTRTNNNEYLLEEWSEANNLHYMIPSHVLEIIPSADTKKFKNIRNKSLEEDFKNF